MCHLREENSLADHLWREYARTRDPRLREALIHQFRQLANGIARRYVHTGVPEDDLAQVAMLGLVKAVDRFDPQTKYRFATFAIPTILGELRRYFRDHYWTLGVPRGLRELAQQVKQADRVLTRELGRSPSLVELSHRLAVSEERLAEAMALWRLNHSLSLDAPALRDETGSGPRLLERAGDPAAVVEAVEWRVSLQQAIAHLPPSLQQVVRLRYLRDLTQREVAETMGVSQMQISRLERRALAALRADLGRPDP